MRAFLLVQVSIPDADRYRSSGYMAMAEKAVAAYGGKFLVRGGEPALLESDRLGPQNQPDRIVILEFPSRDAAQRFWSSAEYGPALKLRQSLSAADTVLLDEYAPP